VSLFSSCPLLLLALFEISDTPPHTIAVFIYFIRETMPSIPKEYAVLEVSVLELDAPCCLSHSLSLRSYDT
jgi:hypothetical protein